MISGRIFKYAEAWCVKDSVSSFQIIFVQGSPFRRPTNELAALFFGVEEPAKTPQEANACNNALKLTFLLSLARFPKLQVGR